MRYGISGTPFFWRLLRRGPIGGVICPGSWEWTYREWNSLWRLDGRGCQDCVQYQHLLETSLREVGQLNQVIGRGMYTHFYSFYSDLIAVRNCETHVVRSRMDWYVNTVCFALSVVIDACVRAYLSLSVGYLDSVDDTEAVQGLIRGS